MKLITLSIIPMFLLVLSILIFSLVGCSPPDPSGTPKSFTPKKLLHEVYSDHFIIGAAVASSEYGSMDYFDKKYPNLLPHYNSLTAENAMKPEVIQPLKGSFNFAPADRIVKYAAANDQKIRGHALVWHNQTSSWMTEGTKEDVRENMKNHIETVMNRYKDSIYSWDVVNEAVSDQGSYRADSPWYVAYGGPEYIIDAFKFAKEVDPECKLVYNDYSVVRPSKRYDIMTMIKKLELQKHGLSGIGIQAHWNLYYPELEELQRTIDLFHQMGLEVHITELDIDCFDGIGNTENRKFDNDLAKRLADRYEEIFELFRKNSDKISSVTFWGIADDHTWLDYFYNSTWNAGKKLKNYPFVFDEDHRAKEAYKRITEF
ncbi:MAG: endo-1,4-beta-xylanase [Spirochaetes bacterium]|jgi:endo-1,4-beta-xylanase|nr:endo-1,4-beta-xylanase [Spirochaetota bacterium]